MDETSSNPNKDSVSQSTITRSWWLRFLFPPKPVETTSTNIMTIRSNFKEVDSISNFYIAQFKRPGGYGSFYGENLIMVQLVNEQWLMALKLSSGDRPWIDNAIVQQKAFPFICDTRSMTDPQQRANRLAKDLKLIFLGYFVHIFIYANTWTDTFDGKGYATFRREYGSEVRLVLT